MPLITRRGMLAAGGTLAAGLSVRKPLAEELHDLATVLVPTDPPVAVPDIAFISADGSEHHLAEFVGHGMVINLWATWCVPCVAEMPALAALSKALAPDDIAVLPLSSDRGGRVSWRHSTRSTGSRGCRCCSIRRARRRVRGTHAAFRPA